MTGNKERSKWIHGERMQTSLQGSVGRNRFTFLKENKATKLDIYMGMDNEFELE